MSQILEFKQFGSVCDIWSVSVWETIKKTYGALSSGAVILVHATLLFQSTFKSCGVRELLCSWLFRFWEKMHVKDLSWKSLTNNLIMVLFNKKGQLLSLFVLQFNSGACPTLEVVFMLMFLFPYSLINKQIKTYQKPQIC